MPPIVELHRSEYLVDIEWRKFREVDNPDRIVPMHSRLGREMVRECPKVEWRKVGIEISEKMKAQSERKDSESCNFTKDLVL